MRFPVNIHVYTFCYNNAPTLPFIIDYWKRFATKVVVYDNMSTDNSLELLKPYKWIEVRGFDTNDTYCPDKIQQIKNECYKECRDKNVDYVFVCDIDEFPLYGDNLMHILSEEKKDGVKVFYSDFYDMLGDKFPEYDENLVQNHTGFKIVKNTNVRKIHMFDPAIDVSFNDYGTLCDTDQEYKSSSLMVMHMQLFGLQAYITRQTENIKRLNKNVTKKSLVEKYGKDKYSCTAYYNNRHAQYYYQYDDINMLMKTICSNDYILNIKNRNKVSEVEVERTNEQPVQYTVNRLGTLCPVQGDIRIPWTEHVLDRPSHVNARCAIVIPVYRTEISNLEEASLKRVVRVLGGKYDIILAGPDDLEYGSFCKRAEFNFGVMKCNPAFFENIDTYSMLCMTTGFYEAFSDYEFIMIYQLDGWIFNDSLPRFLDSGFDYIGSPWPANSFECIRESVGNGGVSLRRV